MKHTPTIAAGLAGAAITAALAAAIPASAAAPPAPRAVTPAAATDICAAPWRHGAVCMQTRHIAIVAGYWRSSATHRYTLRRVPGRFEHQPLYQIHIASQPGRCVGSNPANLTAMAQRCGPGGIGTVFAITPGMRVVSRYWTVNQRTAGVQHDWLLTASRRGNLLRFALDRGLRSQFWAQCPGSICGAAGGTPAGLTSAAHHQLCDLRVQGLCLMLSGGHHQPGRTPVTMGLDRPGRTENMHATRVTGMTFRGIAVYRWRFDAYPGICLGTTRDGIFGLARHCTGGGRSALGTLWAARPCFALCTWFNVARSRALSSRAHRELAALTSGPRGSTVSVLPLGEGRQRWFRSCAGGCSRPFITAA